MTRPRALLAALVALPFLAWSSGFAWFVHRTGAETALPQHADGIVALTGGSGRVEAALWLLAEGRAPIALLSGIGGGAELWELAARAGLRSEELGGRVTLGRHATSTHGNAVEAAAWARANDVRSLIVVTSGYHMPRALAEMAQAMPEVDLHPVSVTPPGMQQPGAIRDPAMMRLMAAEYSKWLMTALGLSRWTDGPALGRAAHASAAG